MKYQNLLLFDNYKNVGNPILISKSAFQISSKSVFKISDPSTEDENFYEVIYIYFTLSLYSSS